MNTKSRKKLIHSVCFAVFSAALLLIFTGTSDAKETSMPAKQKSLKVLFIGNSYTSVGDLPGVITQMAKAKGKDLVCTAHTPGGRSLHKHWQEGKAQKLIEKGGWDFVVLQDQSLNPVSSPKNMLKYADMFCKKIDEIGAKKVFYLTFAYKAPPKWVGEIKDPKKREYFKKLISNMQPLLNKTYLQAAKQNKALVAPAGIAWDIAYKQNPKYPLHASDNSHPADLGVYLSAMVFYSTFFDEPPTDMPARINTDRNGKEQSVITIDEPTRMNMEKIATKAIKTLKEIKSKP